MCTTVLARTCETLSLSVCLENKAVGIMKPGHTFTIEPMINEGEYMFVCDDVRVLVCDACVCV